MPGRRRRYEIYRDATIALTLEFDGHWIVEIVRAGERVQYLPLASFEGGELGVQFQTELCGAMERAANDL